MNRDYSYLIQDMMIMMSYGMTVLPEEDMERFGVLPKEVHHTGEEITRLSCLETMNMTAENLKSWLKSGMEENRFGVPFVQVSKMILNAVTTMGRGLVTLHVMGEDLTEAPMQIGELLDIAGFHFKKCAEGVRVSAGVNPTVCTRLFACQLRWQDLIFRLYRTEEFLKKPYKPASKKQAAAVKAAGNMSVPAEPAQGTLRPGQAFRPFGSEMAVPEAVPESLAEPAETEAPAAEEAAPETTDAAEIPAETDPVNEASGTGSPDETIPYVSDALVQRELARVRALLKTERQPIPPPEPEGEGSIFARRLEPAVCDR